MLLDSIDEAMVIITIHHFYSIIFKFLWILSRMVSDNGQSMKQKTLINLCSLFSATAKSSSPLKRSIPLVVNTFRSFPHSWLITGFVTRVTWQVPLLVEQTLPTLPEHLSSPQVFSGFHVTGSLVLCEMFCRSLFVVLSVFFWPLCCLSFFDLQIQITPLVSSNSSSTHD